MLKVIVLGFGNVGQQLAQAFYHADTIDLVQVYSRSKASAHELPKELITSDIKSLKKAEIYVVAVPDDAIASFTQSFPYKEALVAHTSGSVSIETVSNTHRKAVFYPLQTFSKDREIAWSEVPICLEATVAEDKATLQQLAAAISDTVVWMSSEKRRTLHLAAVFLNNFVNHLYHISEEIINEQQLDFKLLLPLLNETAQKVRDIAPIKAQTGPAKRNDLKTIEKHLALLQQPNQRDIYQLLTKSIQATYGKEL